MPKLIYEEPDLGHEVVIEITADLPEVTIGRNPGNIIRINNPSVSRRHTKFVYEGGGCTVYDLNSSNGTYVNGMRVQSQVLKHGDRIRVGEFPLEFLNEGDGAARQRAETNLGMGLHGFGDGGEMNFGADIGGFEHATSAGAGYDELPLLLSEDDVHVLDGEEFFPEAEIEEDPFDFIQSEAIVTSDSTMVEDGDIAASLVGFGVSPASHDGLFSSSPSHAPTPMQDQSHGALNGSWPSRAAEVSSEELGALEEELVVMRQRTAELAEENDELRRALDNSVSGNTGVDAQTERLRKERDRLADERRNLMRQLADVKKQLEDAPSMDVLVELETELTDARERGDALEADLKATRHVVDAHEQTIQGLEQARDRAASEIVYLQEQFDAVEEARRAVDSERSQLSNQLSEMHGNLEGFEGQYHQARAQIGELEAHLEARHQAISGLEQGLGERDELIEQLHQTISGQSVELQARDERIEALLGSLNAVTEERDEGVETIIRLHAEIDRRVPPEQAAAVQEKLDQRIVAVEALNQERNELIRERDDLIEELSQTRQGAGDFEARFQKITTERDELIRERDTLKQEKAAFARETDYLQVERRKHADQISDLSKKVDDFEKDRKRKKQVFEELSRDLRGLVEENNKLHARVESLESDLEAAPSVEIVESLNRQIEDFEARFDEAQDQVAELEADVTRMTRELGQFAEERDELASQLEAAQEELTTLRAAVEDTSLQDDLSAIQAARDELTEKLASVEEARVALEQELSAVTSAREELAARLEDLMGSLAEKSAAVATLQEEKAQEAEEAATILSERDELAGKVSSLEEELEESRELSAKLELVQEEKSTLEATLTELILDRDRLEDELRKK